MNKYKYIDALRGYAIFFVILGHTGQMFSQNYPDYLQKIINFGPRGVELFFVVSALTLFLTTKKRFVTDKKPLISFFIRRFFRIAPLFYFGFVFYSIILNTERANLKIGEIIGYLSFISSLNPSLHAAGLVPGGWSISAEMIFYLFIPVLIKKLKDLNATFNFALISIIVVAILNYVFMRYSFGFNENLWQSFFSYSFLFTVPAFAIGICIYFLIFENNKFSNPTHQLILITILLFGNILNSGFLFKYITVFIFGLFALYLSKNSKSLLINKLFCFFGKISYSMYISHFFVLILIENYLTKNGFFADIHILPAFVLKLCIALILTSAISVILFNLIEIRFQNIGSKIILKLNQSNHNESFDKEGKK